MANRDIIVIGASSGGVSAFKTLVGRLPRDIEAAIFIAWHISPHSRSFLPEILSRAGELPVDHAADGKPIEHGTIYVAPPDRHLMLELGRMRLTRGPRENRFRPAIDPLFRSAAYAYGPRVIGVILTGALDDGTAGLWAIKDRGGIAVVQDPVEAEQPSMPRSALEQVDVDHCLPVADIASMLVEITREEAPDGARYPFSEKLQIETRIALREIGREASIMKLGEFSAFTCPECHGSLLQIKDSNKLVRFRCHIGHAYSIESLLASLSETTEDAVWSALRSLEENVMLLEHMKQHARDAGNDALAATLAKKAEEMQALADTVKAAASRHEIVTTENAQAETRKKRRQHAR